MSNVKKHWSGHTCPESGNYGQYHDPDGAYAGAQYDRYVRKDETFPPSINNHHFRRK